MKFAVNYSKASQALFAESPRAFDLFKLPAWPELVDQVSIEAPCYIHFPLKVARGNGVVYDSDRKSAIDWAGIERFLNQTHTPLVNIHLSPESSDHPDLPSDDCSAAAAEKITARMIRDVEALTRHFGAGNVIAENDAGGWNVVTAAILPEVIHTVIRETGCGLLLDISHARIAADNLGLDPKEYLSRLPVGKIREIHITGIQFMGENWVARLRDSGLVSEEHIQLFGYRLMDHLPMTPADFEFIAWAMTQIQSGIWNEPWVASCEYGGLGGFFEATLDEAVVREQFPRLGQMVHAASKVL